MNGQRTVAVLVGSLRETSYTRMVGNALIELAPLELRFDIIDIGHLPLYNQDFDDAKTPLPEWSAFRDRVREKDAVLFATPEYNRSIPGVLKNAIDVGSRPPGSSVWNHKPGAVISVSTGAYGGFGANHALRQSMVSLNVPMMQQPEAYLGQIAAAFDGDGHLISDKTRALLQTFIDAFAVWINVLIEGRSKA